MQSVKIKKPKSSKATFQTHYLGHELGLTLLTITMNLNLQQT
jgi:hypothetical protein